MCQTQRLMSPRGPGVGLQRVDRIQSELCCSTVIALDLVGAGDQIPLGGIVGCEMGRVSIGMYPVIRKLPAMRNIAITNPLRPKGSTRRSLLSPNVFGVCRRLPFVVCNRWAADRLPHVCAAAKRQRQQTSANRQLMGICRAGHRSGQITLNGTGPRP